tara:strand:+ start:2015 stop:2191 length:177 start_codon:yes stop_codon:yes gene_type:complete
MLEISILLIIAMLPFAIVFYTILGNENKIYDVDVDEDGPFIVSIDDNEWKDYIEEEII